MTSTPSSVDEADLTGLPGWDPLPVEVQKKFGRARVPRVLLRIGNSATFAVDEELTWVEAPHVGALVRFGRNMGGDGDLYGLAPATGEILLMMGRIRPGFVNSSFDQFAATVRIVARFERVITTGDADGCAVAADEMTADIRRIDKPAGHPHNYWGQFLWDVRAGDFSDNPDF